MTAFFAFHVPPGTRGFEETEISPPGTVTAHFSREGGLQLLASLRAARLGLSSRTSRELAQTLGEIGRRFTDPSDPLRQQAELRIPLEAGVSAAMATKIIDGMARDWAPQPLLRLLSTDFPDPAVLDGFQADGDGGLCRAVGGSLAFHIGSGSVPGVGTTSVIRSLLVKSPVLLKPGRGDLTLPCLFAQALLEVDPELAQAVAVVYWPRGKGDELEEQAIREAERVVAYGGAELMEWLRIRLPATTPLVAYHHRLSLGAVAREYLHSRGRAEGVAKGAAGSVAAFDQRGCVSPQIIWVEEGASIRPIEWAELLAAQLEVLAETLPPGPTDDRSAAAFQQLKVTAELKGAAGSGDRVFGGNTESGTVFFEGSSHLTLSPSAPGRTVVVKPIADLTRLPEVLHPAAKHLQTLALAAPEPRLRELADQLSATGITRISTFANQPWPPAWWRHDGTGPLQALVRWVVLEASD